MDHGVLEGRQRRTQLGLEPAVDLDHVQGRDARGEAHREHPQAAPDLEHDVMVVELGQALDDVEQVAVDEEVLTEVAGAPGAHQPKTAAALRSTAASSSS